MVGSRGGCNDPIVAHYLLHMVEMHEMVPGKRFDRYHELGQYAFGERLGLWVVVPQQLMVEVGVNIVYMITGGKSLKKFHDTVCPDCKDIKTTYFIMIFASVHFVLSHLPSFNSISGVSLAAAVMSLSYSTIAWVASLHKGVAPDVQYTPRASTSTGQFFQSLSALGDVAFAFAGHNVVLEIQATMPSTPEKPSKKPMWRGCVVAYAVVALCYFPVAFIGYWTFGNDVEDNVLISLQKPRWLVAAANLFVVVHVIGSYQIFAYPVFDMVEAFLVKRMKFKPSRLLRFVTRNIYVVLHPTWVFTDGFCTHWSVKGINTSSQGLQVTDSLKRNPKHYPINPKPHPPKMLILLQTPTHFSFSSSFPLKPLNPSTVKHRHLHRHLRWQLVFPSSAGRIMPEPPRSAVYNKEEWPMLTSDGDPEVEELIGKYAPKNTQTEEEARRDNWVLRGWAPWEEIHSPESKFARTSVNEQFDEPLQNPDSIEAFRMMSPKYREKKRKELGLSELEWYKKQFEMGNIPEKLKTLWAAPMAVAHVPPRDWPPPEWEVDREELEYIREAHRIFGDRVSLEELEESKVVKDGEEVDLCLDRYKVFLKQYKEWVAANKDRLEKESYLQDQDYYPGRRRTGKDYKEGMYELPFYYPGQICEGKVTCIALYQGAFVDIGGVHDGWVPIKGNDWYWIRHHIRVGMPVLVEILAKRDPYRFRFPIELRFVFPNIDHLIFNRFEFPPIFDRGDDDPNLDLLRREAGRPPIPRVELETRPEDESLLSRHPYVDKLWQIHVAEQMILDDLEANPEKYKDIKLSELSDDDDYDEKNNVIHTKVYYKEKLFDKTILKVSVKELDLEAALAEREFHNKLRAEAKERGEEYKITKLRRNIEMDEYDFRQALGLPLEEPGMYKPESYFDLGQYDPDKPLFRYDYFNIEPEGTEKRRRESMRERHNKGVVGKGTLWSEASYEDVIEQKMKREALSDSEQDVAYGDSSYSYEIVHDASARRRRDNFRGRRGGKSKRR
ncbi:hypothetical protein Tsubulata_044072 [Turnera subulata]|uniref:S1 motif domain-containing protein n=1 Tax=Turnera subulata TaxID=218843 RepID=A0A9Q0FDD2_9ROSI|nr:hypothetical protein Tsubulata_044072 [Turnera subulata]